MAARSQGEKGRSLKGGRAGGPIGQSEPQNRERVGGRAARSPGENGRSPKGGRAGGPIGQSAPQNRQNGAIAKRRKGGRIRAAKPPKRAPRRPCSGAKTGDRGNPKRPGAAIRAGKPPKRAPRRPVYARKGAIACNRRPISRAFAQRGRRALRGVDAGCTRAQSQKRSPFGGLRMGKTG